MNFGYLIGWVDQKQKSLLTLFASSYLLFRSRKQACAALQQKSLWLSLKAFLKSRDDKIRTCGLFVPNEARYRAALHPVFYKNKQFRIFNIISCPCSRFLQAPEKQGISLFQIPMIVSNNKITSFVFCQLVACLTISTILYL
jgi:hypothetical protein